MRFLVAAFLLVALVGQADAHRATPSPVTQFCGDRVCPIFDKPRSVKIKRVHRDERHERRTVATVTHNYCNVDTAAGPITIACWLAPKMQGFIGDVVARGFKGPVHCLSYAKSHVAHSLHFIAEACDFAQRGWGRTVAVMYHVGDLTAKWGLRNGCSFGDCGHIDSGRINNAERLQERHNLYRDVANFRRRPGA